MYTVRVHSLRALSIATTLVAARPYIEWDHGAEMGVVLHVHRACHGRAGAAVGIAQADELILSEAATFSNLSPSDFCSVHMLWISPTTLLSNNHGSN